MNRSTILSIGMLLAVIAIALGIKLIDWRYAAPALAAPALVGLSVDDALVHAGKIGLSVRLTQERIDNTLTHALVLYQYPRPGVAMKARQPLLITIARPKGARTIPTCVGLMEDAALHALQTAGGRGIVRRCYHPEKVGLCIAQSVGSATGLLPDEVLIWISRGPYPLRIMPNCKGMTVAQLRASLEPYLATIVADDPEVCLDDHAIVINHHPLAGCVLDRLESFVVRVRTQSSSMG